MSARKTLYDQVSRLPVGQVIRYGLATALSALVSLAMPIALHEWLGVPAPRAVAIALVSVFLLGFLTTRTFVFKSAVDARGAFVRFGVASLVFRLSEYTGFLLLFRAGVVYYVAQAIILVTFTIIKFFVLRRFVYGQRRPSAAE